MINRFFAALACSLCALLALSCNLFGPTEPGRGIDTVARHGAYALVVEGKLLIAEEQWAEALRYFEEALARDKGLSEAWFYKGKCLLRLADVGLQDVWDEIYPETSIEQIDTVDEVPFLYNDERPLSDSLAVPYSLSTPGFENYTALTVLDSVFLERKKIYDAISGAHACLEAIHTRRDPYTGEDLSEKMDDMITRAQYEADYLIESSVKTVLGIVDVNINDTLDYADSAREKEAFRIICTNMRDLDDIDFDSLSKIERNPREINRHLDALITIVRKTDTSFVNFQAELIENAAKTDLIDPSLPDPIGDAVGKLNSFLPFMYYNDFADNDSDFYNTNRTRDQYNAERRERMIWIDWDRDGKIDIYADRQVHIGDSADTAEFRNLYTFIDTPGGNFRRFIYTGGYCHEFIGGDWGVDEEILDGIDNDRDGIVDEDTRIHADTLDDDGDFADVVSERPNDREHYPTQWNSQNLIYRVGAPPADEAAVDTLTRFLQLLELRRDTVPAKIPVYDAHAGDFAGGDYGIDDEPYDGIDNDGDGLIDEDVNEAVPPEELRDALIDSLSARGVSSRALFR